MIIYFSPGYTLIEKIGEGTFSEVVKAKDKNDKLVAIKCIKSLIKKKDVHFLPLKKF